MGSLSKIEKKGMEAERPSPRRSTTATSAPATAAAMIAYNEDLLTEILILLPAKILLRFKSVSKLWLSLSRSLISSPSFCHLHTLRHQPEPSFLLRVAPSEYFYFSPTSKSFFPFHFNSTETTILQSCHGLLLLECSNPNKNYHVYNPTTRQSRNLLIENEFLFGLRLAYDPLESLHYKVVCVRTKRDSIHLCEIQVYDSQIHKWKRFEVSYDASLLKQFNDGVYWKNCIYWFTTSDQLVCLDVEAGFRSSHPVLRLLTIVGLRATGKRLFKTSGHVHFVDYMMNSLMVYEGIEQYCGGLVKYSVNCDQITASFPDRISIIGIVRGEDEEKWRLVFHVPGKIVAYGFDDGSLEELIDFRMQKFYREGKHQFVRHDAFQFIESLDPV
ncbi:hypothetical protein CDL12_25911 [Handroanthus impetiginosus]|uniref:F-box associated beta-propeller type 1 domain-containing protein n=1 Tax=Handroanthus impetiginosus TaxID=429701 RepID=A0A2G9G9C6_9LAMI|nr:hypothetical protein CDL12_25911 [Handroanthus impetiginosus]